MFDAVINHSSKSCPWFKSYLKQEPGFESFYLDVDPDLDLSSVTRPRALPLLTKFESTKGDKWVWTTFSEDQVDFNFKDPQVFLKNHRSPAQLRRTRCSFNTTRCHRLHVERSGHNLPTP